MKTREVTVDVALVGTVPAPITEAVKTAVINAIRAALEGNATAYDFDFVAVGFKDRDDQPL